MQNHIHRLRKEAEGYDILNCNEIVREIFKDLSNEKCITLALELLIPHFATFESFHPDIKWVRDWLGYVERREAIDYSSAPFALYDEEGIFDGRGIASPGSDSFLEAIQLLDLAFRAYLSNDKEGECQALASNSILCTIGARVSAIWAEINPQAYEIYMGNPDVAEPKSSEDAEKIRKAASDYRNNPQLHEFRRSLYLIIADRAEAALSGRENTSAQ